MSVTLTVPAEYGYVIMTAVSTFFVNIYHGVLTGQARKKSGITYPVSYADKALADKDPNAYAFNCGKFLVVNQPLLDTFNKAARPDERKLTGAIFTLSSATRPCQLHRERE